MLQNNPMYQQLQATNPQLAEQMTSPETLQRMADPNTLNAMLQVSEKSLCGKLYCTFLLNMLALQIDATSNARHARCSAIWRCTSRNDGYCYYIMIFYSFQQWSSLRFSLCSLMALFSPFHRWIYRRRHSS